MFPLLQESVMVERDQHLVTYTLESDQHLATVWV
jgi:hypothetical protein